MSHYRKAITAIVGAVVAILAAAGYDADDDTVTAVITLLTAVAVYVIPND